MAVVILCKITTVIKLCIYKPLELLAAYALKLNNRQIWEDVGAMSTL